MDPDSVVDPLGGWLAAGRVGGDDEYFVTRSAEMLDHPKHRVRDAVDIREEALCDDRNPHAKIVSSAAVRKVAPRDTTRKNLVDGQGYCVGMRICPGRGGADGRPAHHRRRLQPHRSTVRPSPIPANRVVAVSEDGYGIVAGFDDAPVKVEIFTEPQCNHCADLQADFGDDIAHYIKIGQLAVIYRPLTFLDDGDGRYSARVSNALFLAVDPETSATAFQAFVEELYAQQRPLTDGPSDNEIADMARDSDIPAAVVDRIASGKPALDVVDMANSNFGHLYELNPLDPGTPTVYDPATDESHGHLRQQLVVQADGVRLTGPGAVFPERGVTAPSGARRRPSRPVPPRRPASPPPRSSRRE